MTTDIDAKKRHAALRRAGNWSRPAPPSASAPAPRSTSSSRPSPRTRRRVRAGGFQLRGQQRTAARRRHRGRSISTRSTGLDLYIDGADEANPARQLIKGGGRRPDAREDRRRGRPPLRVHRGRDQAGRDPGQVPAAGRGDPHGTRPGGPRARRAAAAARCGAGTVSPTTATTSSMSMTCASPIPSALEARDQPDHRRGDRGPVRGPAGGCAAGGHRCRASKPASAASPRPDPGPCTPSINGSGARLHPIITQRLHSSRKVHALSWGLHAPAVPGAYLACGP